MNLPAASLPLHAEHQRTFAASKFVYPVLSRRSRGISVGVNLNPDKVCNFDCIYCQVDRTRQSETTFVELDAPAGRTRRHARAGHLRRDLPDRKVRGHAGRAAAAQRYRLQRRRRADHLSQLRRARCSLCRGQAPPRARRREAAADHQRQHVPPASTSSGAWRSWMPTRARSGPSSKRAPRPITSWSSGRRFRSAKSWTTLRPPPGFARW